MSFGRKWTKPPERAPSHASVKLSSRVRELVPEPGALVPSAPLYDGKGFVPSAPLYDGKGFVPSAPLYNGLGATATLGPLCHPPLVHARASSDAPPILG